ncbi:hypothetical protein [Streptomyces sp. NPDC001315]
MRFLLGVNARVPRKITLKLIPISLMPLGRDVVSTDQRFGGR